MRRIVWMMGLLALPLAGCIESDAPANGLGTAYLIDNAAQIPDARRQAESVCGPVGRLPRLSNITQFQHMLVVFDCRPEGEVRFEVTPIKPAS